MRKYISSEVNQHVMKLLINGANVQVVSGKMVYVKFKLKDGIEVSYVYHINKNFKYFLERIKPYPLSIKEFESAADVVDLIMKDYEQFKNAANSKKINDVVDILKSLHESIKSFEDLFLNYNIQEELILDIQKSLKEIHENISQSPKTSKKIIIENEIE